MMRRAPRLMCQMCRRGLTSYSSNRPISLRKRMSKFMLKVHPDTFSQHDVDNIRQINEKSLKTLNSFLDMASYFCNSKQLPTTTTMSDYETTIFPLEFYTFHEPLEFKKFNYTITVPLTLLYGNHQNSLGNQWRIFTERRLSTLHQLAGIEDVEEPLVEVKFNKNRKVDIRARNRQILDYNNRMAEEVDVFYKYWERRNGSSAKSSTSTHTYDVDVQLASFEQDFERVQQILQPEKLLYLGINEKQRYEGLQNYFRIFQTNYSALDLDSLMWNRIVLVMSTNFKSRKKDFSLVITMPYDVKENAAIDFLQTQIWRLKRCSK